MKKGEIWLVNFDPSLGKEYQKIRPAIIIQSEKIKSSLITIMPLSSKIENVEENDIVLKKDLENRLFSDSLIKTFQLSSFDKKRFIHFVGNISKKNTKEINKYLLIHFELDL